MNGSALRGAAIILLHLFSLLAMQVTVSVLVLSGLERTPMPVMVQYVLAVPFSIIFSWLVQGLIIRIVLVCRARRH